MIEVLAGLILLGVIGILVLQLAILRRGQSPEMAEVRSGLMKLQGAVEMIERGGRDDFSRLRQEVAGSVKQMNDVTLQKLDSFSSDANQKIELLRKAVAESGVSLQTQVSTELERMRQTVDEKLQTTLETRLGESFRTVTEQLSAVHKELGAMQTLAAGVGDLKRVLTNVKARGTWGEVQLGSLLEEVLRPEQYERNVPVTGTNERVEYAIRLPGGEDGRPRWLPVDAKFPIEDYQRILDAADRGDAVAVEKACKGLETSLRNNARDIRTKYISEPKTTGFAILFLATEGLYAEALRRSGLAESLQREFNVMLAGPSTFAALLTSLRVGFRTLTIEQKASEVGKRLEEVALAFEKYAGLLGKVRKKLQEASNTVDIAEKGTRKIQKVLGDLEHDGEQMVLSEEFDEFEQPLTASAGEIG